MQLSAKYLLRIALIALTYVLLTKLGHSTTIVGQNVTPVWPASGFSVAILILWGITYWPGIAIGGFFAGILTGVSPYVAAAFATGDVLEAVIAVYLLQRGVGFRSSLERLNDALALLVLGACFSPLASVFIGPTALLLSGAVSFELYPRALTVWWIGDAMGIAVITPLILAWAQRVPLFLRPGDHIAFPGLLAGLFAVLTLLFGHPFDPESIFYPSLYLIFPFIIWSALQFGMRGATTSLLITSVTAVWGTISGFGPFARGNPVEDMVLLMSFLSVHVVTALLLAAVMSERRKSQVQMQAITDSSPIGVFFTDEFGNIRFVNDRWIQIMRVSLEEARSGKWSEIIHPDDKLRVLTAWKDHVHAEGEFVHMFRLKRRDGAILWVGLRLAPIRDQDQLTGFVGTLADITDRKSAEEALRESQARLFTAFESIPFDFWICDAEGRCVFQNSASLKRWGRLIGKFPNESGLPPDIAKMWMSDNERARQGETIRAEFEHRFEDTARLFHKTVAPIRDWDQIRGTIGIYIDVTDQKRAIEAFEESEQMRAMLLSNIPGMAYRCKNDENWSFEVVSDGCHALTGYSVSELTGNPPMGYVQIIHPEDLERVSEKCKIALQTRTPFQEEYRIVTSNGMVKWVSEAARAIYTPDGKVVAMEGFAMDITSRKELEEKFLQAQKLESIGRLAGGISHDFNNLLTTILGYVELSLKEFSRDDPRRQRVEQISEAAHKAADLTRQLLAFARKQVIIPRTVNLNDLIRDLSRMLTRIIGEDIRFTTDLAPDLKSMRVDPIQVDQVLLNLCINAKDAMPAGGKLTVRTENYTVREGENKQWRDVSPGKYVLLTVSDTGEGIRPENLSKIFEPFFTTKLPEKGTGLGLATCYGIVTQSGGHITVESEIGKGTDFYVLFPMFEDIQASIVQVHEPETAANKSEAILLVEDEENVRAVAEQALKEKGYFVLSAQSGVDAIKKVKGLNRKIDLVVSDVVMPHMNGKEMVAELRDQGVDAKVIFMSGYADQILDQNGSASFTFLQKPFTPATLVSKIAEVLDD